ncbi:MAG: crosslink repair DNA glycosylase YcaQ family protein [Planctomycetota bacterium]
MPATPERISTSSFRRRVVAGSFAEYSCLDTAFSELRFVQADPIRSPARAQDLILRQRVVNYEAGQLEEQFPNLRLEEGYLFAYGFMTPDVWKRLRHRPKVKWKQRELKVLDAVSELGDVHPRELDDRVGSKSVKNAWGGKSQENKQILDKLHHHGRLRVSRRENGIRIYQLPKEKDEQPPRAIDRYRDLALTTARVFGPTTLSFLISELRSHNHLLPKRADRVAAIKSLVEKSALSELEVAGTAYLWPRESWADDRVPERVRILAPFDPLVRDRFRFEHLWEWQYRFEAYLPASKRQRGYYAMPVLWRDRVIGWANASVVNQRLKVEFGYVKKRPAAKAFRVRAEKEVSALATFLGLTNQDWELEL